MADKVSSFIGGAIFNVLGFIVGFVSVENLASAIILGIIGGFSASMGRWLWKIAINKINKRNEKQGN